MSTTYYWGDMDVVCDICGWPNLFELAQQKAADIMGKNGRYIGGVITTELAGKWGLALRDVELELQKRCVRIDIDEEGTYICKDCLQKIIDEDNK